MQTIQQFCLGNAVSLWPTECCERVFRSVV